MSVVLHGFWASPYAKRVELALKIKGIPFEYVEEDLVNKSQLLLQYNPIYKKVPVLVHNGNPLCESSIIVQYIDETWKEGPKLLPEDPYVRAQVRFWVHYIDQQLFAKMIAVIKSEGEEQQKAVEDVTDVLATLENGLKSCFGSRPENAWLLDIVLCSFLGDHKSPEELLGLQLFDPEKFPTLHSWVTAINEVPVVKESTIPHDKMVGFLGFIRQQALNK